MFKIESYITPLLMGYVDKYVKLRPEDFQLSLWGGDAVLNNLDLRLDAIEQTLNLPISFKSGHIHELHLHVPWTRLGSEPIVITINTIECIVRLRDGNLDSDKKSSKSGSSSRSNGQVLKIKAKKPQVEEELPPGYLQSLVNKVINNVSIIVNNLILKFVEDDIVLSVNVKSAECYSVSPSWNRTFVEVTPAELILRKVINFCDLTVCLDKCDSSGRIETYQDPLLYRCSLSCRMHMTYESTHSKLPLVTKVNVLCEKLDVSLTDTQLPLFLRLVELCLALYYGFLDVPDDEDNKTEPDSQEVSRQSSGQEESSNLEFEDDQGWTNWAWSFVPQILPEDYEDEDDDDTFSRPKKKSLPPILCMGLYINNASLMLKLTETVREAVHFGPNRVSFRPFLFAEAGGLAVDIFLHGRNYLDVQFGITHVSVASQGRCACDAKEPAEDLRCQVLAKGGESLDNTDKPLSYLTNSLFDITCPENVRQPTSFITDIDEHNQVYTEQYGMQKFGIFWFDYLYTVMEPENKQSSKSSSSGDANGADELPDIRENAVLRFVIGPLEVNVSSSFVHRVEKIVHCALDHQYEPYSIPKDESVNENCPLPTADQVKLLEEYVSTRNYNLTVLQPKIYLLAAEHPQRNVRKKQHVSRSDRSNTKRSTESSSSQYVLPAVLLSAVRFDIQYSQAMYPQHVVPLVSKLAGPSSQLMHHCYTHMQVKLYSFSTGLLHIDPAGTCSHSVTIVPPCSGALYKRTLLFPIYWKNPYLSSTEYMFEIPQLSINLKKAHILFVFHIWKSWLEKKPRPISALDDTLFDDILADNKVNELSESFPLFEVILNNFEMRTCFTPSAVAVTGTLSSIQAVLYINKNGKDQVIPILSGPSSTTAVTSSTYFISDTLSSLPSAQPVDFVVFTIQLPNKTDTPEAPALLQMNVSGLAVLLDPAVYAWLSYMPRKKVNPKLRQQQQQQQRQQVEKVIDANLAHVASPLQGNLSQVSIASSSSTRHQTTMTGPSHSVTQTQSMSQQPKDAAANAERDNPDGSDARDNLLGNTLARWFPLLRIMKLQIEVHPWLVFLSLKSMQQTEPKMDVPSNLRELFKAGLSSDVFVLCLPHIIVHSAGIRLSPIIQDIPVRILEGSLVERDALIEGVSYIDMGDKLPWTITVSNYSMYSLHPAWKAFSLVKPGSVSCTLAVSTKYHPPASDNVSSLALCLHLDMHTMRFSFSLKQIQLCVLILNQLITEGSKLSSLAIPKPSVPEVVTPIEPLNVKAGHKDQQPVTQSVFSHSHTQGQTHSTSFSNDMDVTGLTETSGEFSREATPIRDQDMEDDPELEGVKLSLWLQWTCPKCEVKLYGCDPIKEEESQICCVFEELATSVDVQEIYIKAKANIGTLCITHHQRSFHSGQWMLGPYKGILLSCSPDLAHNTQIITPRLWSSSDSTLYATSMHFFSNNTDIPREKRHGFLSITFTRALCKNVKRKLRKLNVELIGLHDMDASNIGENLYFHKYISEVCLSMEPCDLVIYLPAIKSVFNMADLSALFSALNKLSKTGPIKSDALQSTPLPTYSLTTSTLPLMFVNLSCLRMFIPTGDTSSGGQLRSSSVSTTLDHDMFLLQFFSLALTPQADNPLPRYVVRKHLFAHALQAGITHQPGSAIEDRQYQFDIKGLSLSSACWHSFVKKRSKMGGLSDLVLPSVQIPALEWNTLQCPAQQDQEDIKLIPIVYNFNLKIVVAPPVVYSRPEDSEQKSQVDLLVCGAALEMNVTSDMDFFVSINQVLLLQQVFQKNIACFFDIDIDGDTSQTSETLDRLSGTHLETTQVADSGLGSEISATINYKITGNRAPKLPVQHTAPSFSTSTPLCSKDVVSSTAASIPFEILLTAGRISCMFYTHTFNVPPSAATPAVAALVPPPPTPKSLVSNEHLLGPGMVPFNLLTTVYREHGQISLGSDCSTEQLSASDTGSSSDFIQTPHIVPYLYLYFSQPHTVVTVQPETQKFEMSYYDVMVKGPPSGYTVPVEEHKLLPEYADFNEYWIETRAGQPHPKTGVPPSFFTLRISDFLNKPARVSLQMERPLKLNVSPDKLCLAQEIVQHIQQSLGFSPNAQDSSSSSSSSEKTTKSVKEVTTNMLSHLSWMNQFSLKTEQVVVLLKAKQTEQSPGILTSLTSINMEVTLHQNEVGLVNEIVSSLSLKDVQLKTCYLKQTPLAFIGPSTLNFTMAASQWCTHSGPDYLPKSVLTMDTGLLLVHFGQEHLLCLNHFTEQFLKECEGFLGSTQTVESENKSSPTTETVDYQEKFVTLSSTDDLRTGIFRYIMEPEMTENRASPNQIVFCNCDNNRNSTMTWCYEQARVLSHVTISPVPFSLPMEGQFAKEQPTKIPCTLQYWDSLVNQFFEYINFTLSENESSSLHLPEVKPLNTSELTAAQIWRVVIHQKYLDFENSLPSTPSGSETDETSYPCVLPASLAACMRVDSCFVPTLVPMVQLLVTMPMIMVKFSNHLQHLGKGVPKKLQPFVFYDNEPEDQEWAVLSLDSPAIMGSYWGGYASRTSFQFSCACQLDIVEYRYLTQQTVVQPFSLQGEVTVIPDGEYKLTSVDCNIDNLVVRVGKGAIHTLHCTAEAWKQTLNYPALTTNVCDKVVFCHYIICNDTNCMIRFGQVGTNENLILKSREMFTYGWCSHKNPSQMLHLCVNDEAWHWCDPFSIDLEGRIVRTINTGTHNITFIIKIKPLSNVQNQIIIRGQLLFSNRLSLPLEMKLVTTRRTDSELCLAINPLDSEASLILDDGEVRYLRLRQIGVTSAWSQEVFICGDRMKDNRLVKIPVLDKSQLIHLWCQIFYQNHGTAIQKLIVFSPLFILKSHLPVSLYIDVDTPKLKYHQQVQVPSKGKAFQLHSQGGDIVHSLSFQMGESMQRSSPAMTISTGMIEQVDRTPLQNPVDIDRLLGEWQTDMSTPGWPYIKLQEETSFDVPPAENLSSYSRPTSLASLKRDPPISSSKSAALSALYQDSCSIDLDITLSECWPGCCTILLNITPSYLFTNNTCIDFVLIAPSDQHWNVPQGATFTPSGIQEYFQLGLEINGEVVTSGTIPLSEEELAARRYRTDVGEVLYVDGYVHTAIFTKTKEGNRKAYFFTINSSIQHKIRIITVSERFSIANFSGTPYELQTICVPLGNGKAKLCPELTVIKLASHNKSRYVDNLCPLLCWTLLLQADQEEDIELNEKTNFVQYIRLQEVSNSKDETQHNATSNESHWSLPLRLIANDTGTRLTTAVPVQLNAYATTQPLVLSGHVQDGLTYFVLDTDKSPGCLISNCCPFPISYGQTLMNLTISDVTVLEETELLDCLPTIEPGHCVHYTMPFLNSIFPEIPNNQVLPKLHLSACIQDEENSMPSWNNGIDILSQHDTFVHLPHASDIKVHVERVNMTTYLILEPVSRADISAKEIRSRIKGKETKVLVKEKAVANSKKIAKKTPAFSSVFSLQRANMYETPKLKDVFCLNCGCMLKTVQFVILDETSSPDTFGEILGVSMSTVFLAHYPVTNFQSQMVQISKTSLAICVGNMQIDNQLFYKAQYDFPVILIRQEGHVMPSASLPPIDTQMSAVEKHAILKSASFLHLQVVMETDILSKKSSIVKALEVSIQPLSLFLEDAFIYRLLKELQAFIPTQLSVERSPPDNLKQIPLSIVQASDVINCPVRMQYLCIHPINTLLSVHASLKLFIASDHTPLSFGKFEKEEIFTSSYYLIRTMTMHYASGALVRAGIVVGSLEILGNPTGLIRNIGNGVADLFKLPFTGLTKGPGAFLAGVSLGMSSLLRNVTAGTLTSITNFASSVSRNMDRLSLDSGHQERQEESRRNRPAGLSDGLKQGLTGLGLSLLSAIAGIADQPIQGILSSQLVTENSLAGGFVAGVGKGLVGVVTKPIGGAAEFLSQTGQGILHGVGLTRVPKARFKPHLDAVHQSKNSSIKYIFKTLQSVMPDAKLLLAIEVIQFDVTGFASKVVLLLTPELLFAYDTEDDMSAQMFTLSELECLIPPNEDDDDASLLTFTWQDLNQQLDQQERNPNKDRVTAFLDSASGYVPLPDLSSMNQPLSGGLNPAFQSPAHTSDKAAIPHFEFRVEPYFKEAFITLFRMAKNRLIGRGFPL